MNAYSIAGIIVIGNTLFLGYSVSCALPIVFAGFTTVTILNLIDYNHHLMQLFKSITKKAEPVFKKLLSPPLKNVICRITCIAMYIVSWLAVILFSCFLGCQLTAITFQTMVIYQQVFAFMSIAAYAYIFFRFLGLS